MNDGSAQTTTTKKPHSSENAGRTLALERHGIAHVPTSRRYGNPRNQFTVRFAPVIYLAGIFLGAGAVVVDDAAAADAIADLTALGVDSGPCGAASLAALRVLATEPARSSLGLRPDSSVLLLNTEGSDAVG
jgi:hypothetical protein